MIELERENEIEIEKEYVGRVVTWGILKSGTTLES